VGTFVTRLEGQPRENSRAASQQKEGFMVGPSGAGGGKRDDGMKKRRTSEHRSQKRLGLEKKRTQKKNRVWKITGLTGNHN